MRRLIYTLGTLLGLTSISGCLELSEAFTLNPDGSGKVLVDTVTPAANQFAPENAPKPSPAEVVKQTVTERLSKGKGIEAWSDVSCEVMNDGRVHFRGTAYFPDVNKLKVDAASPAGGGGGDDDKASDVTWKKDGDAMVLHFDTKKTQPPADPNAAKLTDAQVDEKMKEERMQYQQMKPMVQMFAQNLKIQMSFTLPGKVSDPGAFTLKDNTISFALDGKKLMDAMEKVNADDKLVRAKVKGDAKAMDDAMNAELFGKKGPVDAKVTGEMKPLFDYKSEAAKAKAGEAEMKKKLGL